MVRWIAFDDDTAEALVGKFKRGAAEIREGDVLESAARHPESSILVFPSTSPERVLLAKVSPKKAESAFSPDASPQPIPPSAEGVMARAAFRTKKSWWRRTA